MYCIVYINLYISLFVYINTMIYYIQIYMIYRYNINLLFPFRVQFGLVAQSCLALCDPMNRSMPGLPVHHQLPEFTQTHVH